MGSIDAPHAPFIFFDEVPEQRSALSGIINVTLAGYTHNAKSAEVKTSLVAVAYLRCNIPSAIVLRNALNDALLMASPPAGGRAKGDERRSA